MSDNVRSSIGTNDGAVFATDADSTQSPEVHYPINKLSFGPLNTFTLVSATAGLPVQQQTGAVWVIDLAQYKGATVGENNSIHIQPGSGVTFACTQSGTWTIQPGNTANTTPWLMSVHDGTTKATVRELGTNDALNVAICDASGNQITSFGGTSSSFGSAVPATGTAVGFSDGTNMRAARVFDLDSGAGTEYVLGVNLRSVVSGGSAEFGTAANPMIIDPTGTTTQPVSGTVTANAGTGTFTVDTELPAAAALADTTSNPTCPVVGSFLHGWGGSNWNRIKTLATNADSLATTATLNHVATMSHLVVYNGSTFDRVRGDATNGVDVDVTRLPALVAGTSLIGRVSASLETDTIYSATTALTPKFAIIDHATSGDNTVVAAVVGKKVRVLALFLVASAAVTVRFESGAGGTALTGQMQLAANGGFVLPFCPAGWFETAANTLLNLELSGATSCDGNLVYVEV